MLIEFHETSRDHSTFEDGGRRTHVRQFWGRASSASFRTHQVRLDPLVPREGTSDPFDSECTVVHVHAERRERTTALFDFTVISTNAVRLDPLEHPLRRPADIDWSTEQFLRRTYFDVKGKAILNTARDLLLDEREESRWIASISSNLARVPRELAGFENAINSSSVTIDGLQFKKRTLMAKGIRIGRKTREIFGGQLVEFRPVSLQIHHREEGYKRKLPNVGFNELTDKLELIPKRALNARNRFDRDDEGNIIYWTVSQAFDNAKSEIIKRRIRLQPDNTPVTEAVPLDRNGRAIAKPTADNVISIEVDGYRERNFATLIALLRAR